MSELDLQYLEDKATQWPGTEFSRDVLDLIRCLREAEAKSAEADRWADTFRSVQRQREELQARIVQLERVREAAQAVVDASDYYEPLNGAALRSALAAVEEPAKA